MTGKQLRALMRSHKVTIRALAERMDIPMTSIRRARKNGSAFPGSLDYAEACRGVPGLTPEEKHLLALWRERF